MSRLEPYLGVLVALVLVFIIAQLPDSVWNSAAPTESTATSTVAVVPGIILPSLTLPPIATTTEKAVQTVSTVKPKRSAVTIPATQIPTLVRPVEPKYSSADFDNSATALRGALVNIICYAPAGSGLHSISGSLPTVG